jgi:hypothetical protein
VRVRERGQQLLPGARGEEVQREGEEVEHVRKRERARRSSPGPADGRTAGVWCWGKVTPLLLQLRQQADAARRGRA